MLSLSRSETSYNKPESCRVTIKQIVAPNYCRLTFKSPVVAGAAYPGQFVMVYMPREHKYLLPRPFSIFRLNRVREEVSILFEVKGKGTELLAHTKRGSQLRIMGPLGTGFPALPEGSLLVAGGIGIAPLVFLAAAEGKPCTLIYGARTASQLICPPDDLTLPNLTILEVTEDGSKGAKGSVSDLLPGLVSGAPALFACGPRQMLRAVKALCGHSGPPAWFSMEERMACGIGACLGCAVQTKTGYRRVCRDGPVFSAGEVFFDD